MAGFSKALIFGLICALPVTAIEAQSVTTRQGASPGVKAKINRNLAAARAQNGAKLNQTLNVECPDVELGGIQSRNDQLSASDRAKNLDLGVTRRTNDEVVTIIPGSVNVICR